MSLTILFQFPVDTGTAKISPKVEKANLKDFYLLTGKSALIWLLLRRSVRLYNFIDQAPSSVSFPKGKASYSQPHLFNYSFFI